MENQLDYGKHLRCFYFFLSTEVLNFNELFYTVCLYLFANLFYRYIRVSAEIVPHFCFNKNAVMQ